MASLHCHITSQCTALQTTLQEQGGNGRGRMLCLRRLHAVLPPACTLHSAFRISLLPACRQAQGQSGRPWRGQQRPGRGQLPRGPQLSGAGPQEDEIDIIQPRLWSTALRQPAEQLLQCPMSSLAPPGLDVQICCKPGDYCSASWACASLETRL